MSASPIQELFVRLGFEIKGDGALTKLDERLKSIAASATAAAVAINKLNGATPREASASARGASARKTRLGADGTKITHGNTGAGLHPATAAFIAQGLQAQAEADEVASAIAKQRAEKAASSAAGIKQAKAEMAEVASAIAKQTAQKLEAAKKAANDYTQSINKASESLNKLAAAFAVAAAGAVLMINRSLQNAMAMNNFADSTGLAVDKMQSLQYQMELAGASGDELAAVIKGIQSQQSKIRLGQGGDLSGFNYFGVGVMDDPAEVFKKIQERIKAMPKSDLGIGREMASRAGFSDEMFAAARRSGSASGFGVNMTQEQLDSMQELNSATRELMLTFGRIKDKVVATVAPMLSGVLKIASFFGKLAGVVLDLINANNPFSRFIKGILSAVGTLALLVIGLGAMAIGVAAATLSAWRLALALNAAAISAGAKGVADMAGKGGGWIAGGASKAWDLLKNWKALLPAAYGLLKTIGGFLAAIAAPLAALIAVGVGFAGAVYLVVDEIYTSLTGGVSRLRDAGEWIGDKITKAIDYISDSFDKAGKGFKEGFSAYSNGNRMSVSDRLIEASVSRTTPQMVYGANTTVTNDIRIDGAASPQATAEAVKKRIDRSYSDTLHASPAASY